MYKNGDFQGKGRLHESDCEGTGSLYTVIHGSVKERQENNEQ